MLSLVTPHLRLASVLELRPDHLRSNGRQGLLLDLDCTLKDYHAVQLGSAVRAWVESMRRSGVRMCLVTNGRPRRIEPFAQQLGIPFVAQAFKPLPFGCRKALGLIELRPEQAAIVGDQLFADILAGRLAGLFTILVPPTSPIEPLWTRLKRPFERRVLRWTAPLSAN